MQENMRRRVLNYSQKLAIRTLRRLLTPRDNMNASISEAFIVISLSGSADIFSPLVMRKCEESSGVEIERGTILSVSILNNLKQIVAVNSYQNRPPQRLRVFRNQPEFVILGSGLKNCGLWGREWAKGLKQLHTTFAITTEMLNGC